MLGRHRHPLETVLRVAPEQALTLPSAIGSLMDKSANKARFALTWHQPIVILKSGLSVPLSEPWNGA
jgi:hypothetical protein